jgi:uncharacterized protein YcbK (DUF882 family)
MSEQLSRNFARSEFACRCGCGADHVKPELIDVLQRLRDRLGVSIRVTSGVRCARHNARIKGARSSQHLLGAAGDIQVAGFTPRQVAREVDRLMPRTGGIKAYRTFTHVDVRPGYWRSGL